MCDVGQNWYEYLEDYYTALYLRCNSGHVRYFRL